MFFSYQEEELIQTETIMLISSPSLMAALQTYDSVEGTHVSTSYTLVFQKQIKSKHGYFVAITLDRSLIQHSFSNKGNVATPKNSIIGPNK